MADIFEVGETVVCSPSVTKDGVAFDPVTSMKCSIIRLKPSYDVTVADTAMSNDSTGEYHYDFQSAGEVPGTYKARYTSTNGLRITIEDFEFELI
jgi:hypothetical protein